jgi:hypothetical protein
MQTSMLRCSTRRTSQSVTGIPPAADARDDNGSPG